LRGVRSVGAALGGALAEATPRKPAWGLARGVIVLPEAAPCLASGPWHLPKPCQHNAITGRHRAGSRIAQRNQDLFRCVAGLFRSVRALVRPGAGAFRIRSCHVRSRPWHNRVDLATSRAGLPCSRAVLVKSGADLVKDGAGLMQIGHDQGKDARVWSRTMATRPESIGTVPSSTSSICRVATGKPWAAAEQGQTGAGAGWTGAEEGWIGAGKGNAAATVARNAAEKVCNATVLAWCPAVWPSMAAGRAKMPAVLGYSRADQRMADAEEGKTDRGMVSPLVRKR